MKKRLCSLPILVIVALIFVTACSNAREKENETNTADAGDERSDTSNINSSNEREESNLTETAPIWVYDPVTSMPVKNREVELDFLTPQNLVTLLNKAYKDKVQLEFMKLSGDTIFVAIPESTVLTRQMGSTGADGYLATATFTLTELEGITHVNFDFEEGDHARPGIYNRQFYLDRKKR